MMTAYVPVCLCGGLRTVLGAQSAAGHQCCHGGDHAANSVKGQQKNDHHKGKSCDCSPPIVLAAGDLHPVPVDLADAPIAVVPSSVGVWALSAVVSMQRAVPGRTVLRPTLSLLRQHCALIV